MEQPTFPRWATSGAAINEPPEGKKDVGWVGGVTPDRPPAEWFNWLLNQNYMCHLYWEHVTDGHEGRLDAADGRLDAAEGRLDGAEGRLDGAEGRLTSMTTVGVFSPFYGIPVEAGDTLSGFCLALNKTTDQFLDKISLVCRLSTGAEKLYELNWSNISGAPRGVNSTHPTKWSNLVGTVTAPGSGRELVGFLPQLHGSSHQNRQFRLYWSPTNVEARLVQFSDATFYDLGAGLTRPIAGGPLLVMVGADVYYIILFSNSLRLYKRPTGSSFTLVQSMSAGSGGVQLGIYDNRVMVAVNSGSSLVLNTTNMSNPESTITWRMSTIPNTSAYDRYSLTPYLIEGGEPVFLVAARQGYDFRILKVRVGAYSTTTEIVNTNAPSSGDWWLEYFWRRDLLLIGDTSGILYLSRLNQPDNLVQVRPSMIRFPLPWANGRFLRTVVDGNTLIYMRPDSFTKDEQTDGLLYAYTPNY